MASEVGKRAHPDYGDSHALVKRQKTEESALVVGTITKDVSGTPQYALGKQAALGAAYCSWVVWQAAGVEWPVCCWHPSASSALGSLDCSVLLLLMPWQQTGRLCAAAAATDV